MKKKRILITILTVILVIGMFPLTAFAASASVSSTSTTVGSTVSITVKFSGSNIFGVQATFSYDKSVIQYVSGNNTSDGGIVLYGSSEGASSLSTTIKFKALKVGSAKISVSASNIYDYDLNSLGTASASGTVTVKEKAATPSTSKTPEVSPTPTINPLDSAIPVTVDEQTLYLWTILADITPPSGFTIIDSTYQEQKIQAASANNLTLVYLTDQTGVNGSFYVLDNGAIYPYLPIAINKAFTIVKPDSSVVVPSGYTETTVNLQDRSVQAWESAQAPGFCLLYVMNSEGQKDFYTYDTLEGTLQRYTDRAVAVGTVQTPGFFENLKSNPTLMAVFIALAGLTLILAVICIVLIIKKRQVGKHFIPSEKSEESEIIQ